MKCRNTLLEYFCEEFSLDLDLDNYKNVDLSITEDYKFIYREDIYTSKEEINSMKELESRYHRFKERADKLIEKKEIDFQNRSKWNEISNILIIICIILAFILILYLGLTAIFQKRYFDTLWLLVIIIPNIIPRLRESFHNRLIQAKNYLKKNKKK